MKFRILSLLLCLGMSHALFALKPIVYNGDSLEWNTEFKRLQTGMSPSEMPEISGMSCSRVTPGYLWIQSDDNSYVAAMDEKGTIYCKHYLNRSNITNAKAKARYDWEGLSTGVYLGKNTIFVGGFGDNDLKHKDNYFIYYFEEPSIPSTRTTEGDYKITVDTNYIWYGYPDSAAHNTEAVMFDNVDEVLYIVDKTEKNVNTVFSLDMKDTVYDGTKMVRLKEVCKLGKDGEFRFQRATAADITPDGRRILIKNNTDNYSYTLIWERNLGESVGDALKRQPKQVKAYLQEWQGETLAWLDGTTFYTTSDEDGSAPIFKYVPKSSGVDEVLESPVLASAQKLMVNNQLLFFTTRGVFNIMGQRVE